MHDYEETKKLPPLDEVYTEDQLWEALTWFIERITPVCEKAKVKMGYHPNDPCVSPYRGSAQIMISPAAYRRLFAIADSPYNGATFGQGNFASMRYAPGEDMYSVATEFAERGKIQFVHFRDVDGKADTRYYETFHDNGPTDMARMLECYARGGFVGPLRTDHAPAMAGEDSEQQSRLRHARTHLRNRVHQGPDAGAEYRLRLRTEGRPEYAGIRVSSTMAAHAPEWFGW